MHLKGAQVRTEFFVERTVPRHFMSQAEKKHILYNILQYYIIYTHIYYILIYIYIFIYWFTNTHILKIIEDTFFLESTGEGAFQKSFVLSLLYFHSLICFPRGIWTPMWWCKETWHFWLPWTCGVTRRLQQKIAHRKSVTWTVLKMVVLWCFFLGVVEGEQIGNKQQYRSKFKILYTYIYTYWLYVLSYYQFTLDMFHY